MDERRILLVEDQEDIRWLVRETLDAAALPLTLREAGDGPTALRILSEFAPQVAILDVMLPGGIDGYSLCEHIRRHPALGAATFVILLTARGQQADRERGQAVKANLYMTKPFSPVELLAAVEAHFAKAD